MATGERLPVTSPVRLDELIPRRALALVGVVLPATLGIVRLPLAETPLAVGEALADPTLLAALEEGIYARLALLAEFAAAYLGVTLSRGLEYGTATYRPRYPW